MFTLSSNGPSARLKPLMLGSKMWSYSSTSDVNFALISCLGQGSHLQSVLYWSDELVA